MPLKAPESYELDRADEPLVARRSVDDDDDADDYDGDDSDASDVDEFDPLKEEPRSFADEAARPLRRAFSSSETPSAWTRDKAAGLRAWCVPSRFCCMLVLLFIVALLLLFGAGGLWAQRTRGGDADAVVSIDGASEAWYPTPAGGTLRAWQASYKRAANLVRQMTLVEKVNVTTGTGWSMDMCVGNTGAVHRVGFPSLCLQDGPLNLRFADNITAFPAGITVGATWNKDLMFDRGRAQGLEARLKGVNVLLGPSMGPLGRLPAGGRNWEAFGADPVLQGIAAAATIDGIQTEGVMATAKHYVGNEQEHFRQAGEWGNREGISSNIDDRTLHEIYAWPFAESVRAGVASVMCSYNQVNNSYACQNSKLLNGVLKDELGFQGFVQSDWLAQRSGVASALAGLDMSMPGDGLSWQDGKSLWGSELTKAVLNESLPIERLNDMAMRIVAAWYQLGQDEPNRWPDVDNGGGPNFSSWTDEEVGQLHPGSPDSNETAVVNRFVPVRHTIEGGNHDDLARRIAAEGTVLVKNENKTLPLARVGTNFETHAHEGALRVGIFGEDAFNSPNGPNACADRGCNEGTLSMGWGSGSVELPYLISPAEALHRNFDNDTVQITDWAKNDVEQVDGTAAAQDICLVFITADAGEGYLSWGEIKGDRNDLYPQKGGDELVKTVAANCGGRDERGLPLSNTIVVLHTVGPTILERWVDEPGVKAVLIAHLPGQESGNALADVVFGDVNPSGRLPYTIAKDENDYGPTSGILRAANGVVPQQNFTEGLYIDYRYFDKHGITPRYEFGYGLSYTDFRLSSLFVHHLGTSGREPKPRPKGIEAPRLNDSIPDPKTALFPEGFRKLKKYIYPYIDNVDDVKHGTYDYPRGYDLWHRPSPAGGGEGGNPDLYEPAVNVQATLTNLGKVPGNCVVQLYISYPADVVDSRGVEIDMPVKVLRNWDKIYVGVKNSEKRQEVKMQLTRKDLSYWDVELQNWVMPDGEFGIYLGFSSRDFPTQSSVSNSFKIGGLPQKGGEKEGGSP